MNDKKIKISSVYGETVRPKRLNELKVTLKKSELEYCFQADTFEEFEKRYDKLKCTLIQRFQNEISRKEELMLEKAFLNRLYGKRCRR